MGTCSICGHRARRLIPAVSAGVELERPRKKIASNHRYHHCCGGWKSKKVRHQWAWHGVQTTFVPKNFPADFGLDSEEEEFDFEEPPEITQRSS